MTRRWRKSRNLTVHISIPDSAKKGGRPPGLDVQVAVIGIDLNPQMYETGLANLSIQDEAGHKVESDDLLDCITGKKRITNDLQAK